MKVLIHDSAEAAIAAIANRIVEKVIAKPTCVLGLATGGTVEPVYEALVQKHEQQNVSYSRIRTFNLDEYVGLSPDHPMSYHHFMEKHLFGRTDIKSENTSIPFGNAINPNEEARRYEAAIKQCGGIDCQLLGIGENGHIGFNEPTSSLSSTVRIKTLAPETVRANSRYFKDIAEVPRLSITMGIGTILCAREIVLIAIGDNKSKAALEMIEGPLSARCPASALQLHPHAEVYLDEAAASQLTLRDYYEAVHPNGKVES